MLSLGEYCTIFAAYFHIYFVRRARGLNVQAPEPFMARLSCRLFTAETYWKHADAIDDDIAAIFFSICVSGEQNIL